MLKDESRRDLKKIDAKLYPVLKAFVNKTTPRYWPQIIKFPVKQISLESNLGIVLS